MAQVKVTIITNVAWWFTWLYLPMLRAACFLGYQPNSEKFHALAKRAVLTRVKKV